MSYRKIATFAASLILAACGGGSGTNDAIAAQVSVIAPVWVPTVATAGTTCLLNNPSDTACAISVDMAKAGRIYVGSQYAHLAELDRVMKIGGTYGLCFEGGSITVGEHGWPDISKTYAGEVLMWYQAKYPNSKFNMFNDAVSGTSSAQGADRIGAFLAKPGVKCDIAIVEFAVNDNYICDANVVAVQAGYDRLLRQLDLNGSVTVMFETMLPTGKNAQRCHIPVGQSHNVAMIVSIQDSVWPWVANGSIPTSWFDYDGTHPNAWGHREFSSVLTYNLGRF